MTATAKSIKAQQHLVSGRVQGVFFRASTCEQALSLGIKGYAKNLADGRVEVIAVGDDAALKALHEWLWRGPPAASVTEIKTVDVNVAADEYAGFYKR